MLSLAILLAIAPTQQDTVHFAFETITDQEMDASAIGQGLLNINMSMSGVLSVVVRDTTEGQVLDVSVDTFEIVTDSPQIPVAMMQVPGGSSFQLHLVDGKVVGGFEMTPETLRLASVVAVAGGLLPPRKDNFAVGMTWTDTVTVDSAQANGVRTTAQTISSWRVSSVEGGVVELMVEDNGNTSGTMGEQGEMSAVTTATRRLLVAPDGMLLEMEGTMENDMQMLMGGNPMMVAQRVTSTINRVL